MSTSCSLDDRDFFLCHSDSVKDVQAPCPTFTVFGEHRRPCLNSTKCSRGNALPFVLDVSLFLSVARRCRWLRGNQYQPERTSMSFASSYPHRFRRYLC